MTLTVERVRHVLDYDADAGSFTWRVRLCRSVKVGAAAGSREKNGYVRVAIDGERYLAHRLAWFYTHGTWPPADIDHINGVRDDNRLSNLRPATRSQNNAYAKRINACGCRGVSWAAQRGKWQVFIRTNGKKKNLGRFSKLEDAAEAYRKAAAEYHGEFARA